MPHITVRRTVVTGLAVCLAYQLTHELIEPDHHANPHTHQDDFNPFATRMAWEYMSSGNSLTPDTGLATIPRFRPYTRVTFGDVEID